MINEKKVIIKFFMLTLINIIVNVLNLKMI